MKNLKRILTYLPESYFLVLVLISGYTPPFSFNPFLLGVSIVIILQILFQNRITGLIIGLGLLSITLYMFGALMSEFSEFTEFNQQAQKLLFVGMSLWTITMLAAVSLIFKYLKKTVIHDNTDGST